MILLRLTIIAVALVAVGCATTKNPDAGANASYVHAIKLENTKPEPVAVTVTRPVPLPGQLKPLPADKVEAGKPRSAKAAATSAAQMIDQANAAARQSPDREGYYNSIMVYDYDPGALYKVYAAPLKLTDIQLQPGEKIISKPGIGDKVRWKAGIATSVEGDLEQQHLLITPRRPQIDTTLVINTDRRTYHVELHSYKETYMAAVSWNYPQEELEAFSTQAAVVRRENAVVDSAKVDVTSANFAYTIKVTDGKPTWTPLRVFDSGKKTYIEFSAALAVSDAPALYVEKFGDAQLVNYRQRGLYYIVDGVFARYELRVGTDKEMETVLITNDKLKQY